MKKVDLSLVPMFNWCGRRCFDWNNSIGASVDFVYDDINGTITIKKYDKLTNTLTIQYKNEEFEIKTENLKSVKLGSIIHSIIFLAPHMIRYIRGGHQVAKRFTPQSNRSIVMICPKCQTEKTMRISNLYNKGFSCICEDGLSRPNKFMYYILKHLGIVFEREKTFNWCVYKLGHKSKRGSYDFTFDKDHKKYIVEMDGGFHRKPYKGSKYTVKDIEFIDSEKDRLAKENGYKMIRIDCTEGSFINMKENILASELSNVLCLSSVDWDYCVSQAEKNLVLEVAQYYMSNKPIEIKEIARIFQLSCVTICDYLKRGAENNWCDYDVEYAKKTLYEHNAKRNIKRCSKKVAIFKDKKHLGTYDSGKELSRNSIKDFGIQFNYKKISAVATGREKHHKGFVFKYV